MRGVAGQWKVRQRGELLGATAANLLVVANDLSTLVGSIADDLEERFGTDHGRELTGASYQYTLAGEVIQLVADMLADGFTDMIDDALSLKLGSAAPMNLLLELLDRLLMSCSQLISDEAMMDKLKICIAQKT